MSASGTGRPGALLSAHTMEENGKQRRFHFRINRISAVFQRKIDKCFFEFEVGGRRKEVETPQMVDLEKEENVRDADGNVKKELVKQVAYQKRFQVLKKSAGIFYTLCHSNIKPNLEVQFPADTFTGTWRGSHNDLSAEALVVRVWLSRTFSSNVLIGELHLPLMAVADSKMERRLEILQLNDRSQASKELLCTLALKIEFQEAFNFDINFHNWQVVEGPKTKGSNACGVWFCCLPFQFNKGTVKFKLRRSRLSWSQWLATHFKACLTGRCFHGLSCCPMTCLIMDQTVAFVRNSVYPNAATVPYRGTAAWLENDNLELTLRQGYCLWCSRTAGSTVVPLQGALDSTYLEVPLDNLLYENCSDWLEDLCCPSAYLSRTRANAAKPTGFRHQPYQVSGQVSVQSTYTRQKTKGVGQLERPKWPRFRQLGNADPLRTGPAQAFVGPKDVSTFLVVKVRRAQGLTLEDEYRDRVNPHVEVEWRSVKKTTRTVPAEGNPSWEEELFFMIPDYQCRNSPPKKEADFTDDMKKSPIIFSIWDTNRHDVRPLGFCEIDFSDILHLRRPRVFLSFANQGYPEERLVYSTRRQLRHYLTPTTMVPNLQTVGVDHVDADSVPQWLEIEAYFDRLDHEDIPVPKKYNPRAQRIASHYLLPPLTTSCLTKLALPDTQAPEAHFFPVYGVDERFGGLFELPHFIRKLPLPQELGRSPVKALQYVSAIEFTSKPLRLQYTTEHGSRVAPHVWTWCDPYLLLQKRRGDVKDHALLLACYLAGLGFDPYVCVGVLKGEFRHGPLVPHFWVFTGSAPKDQTDIPKGMLFWETTNGRVYRVGEELPYLHMDAFFSSARLFWCGPNFNWFSTPGSVQRMLRLDNSGSFFGAYAWMGSSRAMTDGVAQLTENEIVQHLYDSIKDYRLYERSSATHFLPRFPFQSKDQLGLTWLRRRLDLEILHEKEGHQVFGAEARKPAGGRPPGGRRGHGRAADGKPERTPQDDIQSWRNHIKRYCKEHNRVYSERLLVFKHCNAHRIADVLLERVRSIFDLPQEQNPGYLLAAKIQRLPGGINTTHVIVSVLHG